MNSMMSFAQLAHRLQQFNGKTLAEALEITKTLPYANEFAVGHHGWMLNTGRAKIEGLTPSWLFESTKREAYGWTFLEIVTCMEGFDRQPYDPNAPITELERKMGVTSTDFYDADEVTSDIIKEIHVQHVPNEEDFPMIIISPIFE